jgi:hypothetical protein
MSDGVFVYAITYVEAVPEVARTQQQLERVADEVLHATTNHIDGDGRAEEEGKCFEFPCQVEQRIWFNEMTFVCMFVLHALFETVISKMVDCGGSLPIHLVGALVCFSCHLCNVVPLVPNPYEKCHRCPYFAEDRIGVDGGEHGGK